MTSRRAAAHEPGYLFAGAERCGYRGNVAGAGSRLPVGFETRMRLRPGHRLAVPGRFYCCRVRSRQRSPDFVRGAQGDKPAGTGCNAAFEAIGPPLLRNRDVAGVLSLFKRVIGHCLSAIVRLRTGIEEAENGPESTSVAAGRFYRSADGFGRTLPESEELSGGAHQNAEIGIVIGGPEAVLLRRSRKETGIFLTSQSCHGLSAFGEYGVKVKPRAGGPGTAQ